MLLVGLKLWLVAAQPVVAHANASFDDRLYLALAEPLLLGQWLGPYSQFTLMKGPMYSIFIAGVYWIHLPLPVAQHFLYLLGCALLILALRPRLAENWQAFALFALLWWQPMSYFELDVLRQNIYTPLTLLIFAGLFALETRRLARTWVRLIWGTLLGVSAGAFYLTREEGVWILPSALLLIAAAGWKSWRAGERFRPLFLPLLAAIVCASAIIGSVCTLNYRHYGWFGTVELRAPEFLSAYGALQRPISPEEIPYVPVTRETRAKIYEVSPAFAELKPFLEGPIGSEWANYSDYLTGRPGEELQISSGSWIWALRDAVVASGHASSARDALDFYRRLGEEVNQACDDGRLGAVRKRQDALVPPWRAEHAERLRGTAPGYIADFLLFRGFTAYPTESWGSADLLTLFSDLTRWHLAQSNEAPELYRPVSAIDHWRLVMLETIGNGLRWACVVLIVSGLGMWLWAAVSVMRRRTVDYLFIVATASLGSTICVLVLNMLVQVLAFLNRGPTALHEGYPLLVLFGAIAWISALYPAKPVNAAHHQSVSI